MPTRTSTLMSLAAILLAVAAGPAQAAFLNFSCTVISTPTELSGSLDCPQYAGSGTLQSVQLTIEGSISGSITLTNNSAASQQVNATTASDFYQSPALAGPWAPAIGSPLFSASFSTGLVTLSPGQQQLFAGLASGTVSWTGTNTTNLAPYIGAGNFSIPIFTMTGLGLVGGGGQVGAVQSTNGSATAYGTYEFLDEEIPEPGTWALMVGGLALLGLARIRRRA